MIQNSQQRQNNTSFQNFQDNVLTKTDFPFKIILTLVQLEIKIYEVIHIASTTVHIAIVKSKGWYYDKKAMT